MSFPGVPLQQRVVYAYIDDCNKHQSLHIYTMCAGAYVCVVYADVQCLKIKTIVEQHRFMWGLNSMD